MTHKPLMDIQTGKYLLHPEGLASGYYDLCRVPNGDLTQTPEKIFSRTLNEAWSIARPFVDIHTKYDLSYPLCHLIKGQATGCHIVHPEGKEELYNLLYPQYQVYCQGTGLTPEPKPTLLDLASCLPHCIIYKPRHLPWSDPYHDTID